MTSNNSIIVPQEDFSCMLQQTENETNIMVAGMLSIINENETLNEGLQSQGWCKRMLNTIIGKNKATAMEIRQNHDKLNAYVVQAVGELYNRNKISSQIMVSLGLQITQLYNSHLELKSALYSIANKLNEKIESVDNYHTLLQEIDEGIYGREPKITRLMAVISQIDYRIISDSKKMRLLEHKLANNNLINTNKMLNILDYMTEISDLQDDSLGVVYADLQLYGADSIIVTLALNTIESWNLLAASNRRLLKKQVIINQIIDEIGVDESAEFGIDEFYDDIITLRRELINHSKDSSIGNAVTYSDEGNEDDDDLFDLTDSSLDEDQSIDEELINVADFLRELDGSIKEIDDGLEEYDGDSNISDLICNYVEYYLGSESSCVTHVGYIGYDLRAKAKKNIVDKSDSMSGIAGAIIGGVLLGPLGALGGAALGNNAKNEQAFTCDADDIIAIVDASSFGSCKDGLVFTKEGVFFSQTGDVSIYIAYDDIVSASGTTGFLGGKLEVERYLHSDFTWSDTIIPKNKVARLLNELKDIC